MLTPEQMTGRDRSHVVRHDGEDWYCELHPQALEALLQMRAVALGDGLDIIAVSSYRDFARQAAIWNAKYRGDRPLLDRNGDLLDAASLQADERVQAILWWSALPGASRHHWGTDFDVIDRAALTGRWAEYQPQLLPAEFAPDGVFGRLGSWLAQHASQFGFFRPYGSDREFGVRPEPWHLSFAPLAVPALAVFSETCLRDALCADGIDGVAAVLGQLPQIVRHYVRGIDLPA